MRFVLFTSVALCIVCLSSCKRTPEPEGYLVTGYDGKTKEWILLDTYKVGEQMKKRRFILVCDFYKWGDREPSRGYDQCHLNVGELLVTNAFPSKPSEYLDIWVMPMEILDITQGTGADRVEQQFEIRKLELLQ